MRRNSHLARLGTYQSHGCQVCAKLVEPRGECHSLLTLRSLMSVGGDGHGHSPVWILGVPTGMVGTLGKNGGDREGSKEP